MSVSVVVATYNQWNLLARLLDALAQQTISWEGFEIVVVNDGSTDETGDLLLRLSPLMGNVRVITHTNRGPAASRNRGIAAARGDLVAFTDSDCVPEHDWVERVAAAFTRDPAVLGVEGAVYTTPEDVGPFTHQVENLNGGLFCTANMAYRREALIHVGGFDEDFTYGHEDTDLSLRIAQLGKIVFDPAVRVLHPPVPMSFRQVVRRPRVWTCQVVLAAKHPRRYRDGHGRSPFRTLTWHYGVVQLLQRLWRFRGTCAVRPLEYLVFVLALFLQRVYMLGIFPSYFAKYLHLTQSPARRAVRHRSEQVFHDALFRSLGSRGDFTGAPPPELESFVEHALSYLGSVSGHTILDCGCGDGSLSVWLALAGARVIALDISVEALELTGRRAAAAGVRDRVRLVHGSLEELPLKSGSVDRAIGSLVVHHVDPTRAGAELARVLAAGGRAAFSENFAFNPFLMLARNHLVGRFGIRRLGTLDEKPLDAADVSRFAGPLARELAFPELLFFRLLDRQIFKYRYGPVTRVCAGLDRFLFDTFPSLHTWSYRGTLVVWRS